MNQEVVSGHVTHGGGRLYFESRGSGHPVVLAHAGIADRRMWDRQFEKFAQRYRVVRYDARGFGRSDRPTRSYSDADDLLAILTHLEFDLVRLIGVSNGGRIALDFASAHPEMVEALVPVSSGLSGFEMSDDPEMRAAFDRLEQETQSAGQLARTVGVEAGIDRMIEIWARAVPASTRPAVVEMMRENRRMVFDEDPNLSTAADPPTITRLASLQVPTLVLEGELDQPVVHYFADAIAHGIPGAVRKEIKGADHLVNLSQPDAFDQAVLDFLE